jgi:hypothetical protein
MSSNSLGVLFASIPKFDGTNWVTFKKDVEVYLQLEGNWGVMSGEEKRPKDPTEAATWDGKDKRTYSILYFLIQPEFRSLIIEYSSGVKAWSALKAEFEKDSSATRLSLRNQFYSVRHDPTKPVSLFIETVQSIARQLKTIGHAPGANEVEDIILLRLDPSFESIRSSLITRKDTPTLTEIISAVKQFEQNQEVINPDRSLKKEEDNAAMMSAKTFGTKFTTFDWGNQEKREGVCYRCGKSGHVAAKCIHDMPKKVKDAIIGNKPEEHAEIAQVEEDFDDYAFLADDAHHDFSADNLGLPVSSEGGIPTKRSFHSGGGANHTTTSSEDEYTKSRDGVPDSSVHIPDRFARGGVLDFG